MVSIYILAESDCQLAESLKLDLALFQGIDDDDAVAVQQALQNGANVNCARQSHLFPRPTPLLEACVNGNDQIIRILLDAGANTRWEAIDGQPYAGWTALTDLCSYGHFSTVQLLVNHDNGLVEDANEDEWTPLFVAIRLDNTDIVRFLLNRGANALATDVVGMTTLMMACAGWGNLEIVRLLLATGVPVEARCGCQRTALHYATLAGSVAVARELILEHNADMLAVDWDGRTPFDLTGRWEQWSRRFLTGDTEAFLIEAYGNKMAQEQGHLALHAILGAAKYTRDERRRFLHPPLIPLQVCSPLGILTLEHFLTLLHTLDTELVRNRDDSGKLPIHIACQANAPFEVLSVLVKIDPAPLRMADYKCVLPLHLLCGSNSDRPIEYASVKLLVEQGGVGILAARNPVGALPLHILCGSPNPVWSTVQFLIQSFPGAVAARTNAGHYALIMAACDASSASLSVVYELARANPNLIVPNYRKILLRTVLSLL